MQIRLCVNLQPKFPNEKGILGGWVGGPGSAAVPAASCLPGTAPYRLVLCKTLSYCLGA